MRLMKKFGGTLSIVLAASVLAACSPNASTPSGDAVVSLEGEGDFGALRASQISAGMDAYVSGDKVNVRTSPQVAEGNLIGALTANDRVQIVDPSLIGSEEFIAVRIIRSSNPSLPTDRTVYVTTKYLDASPSSLYPTNDEWTKRNFVVTNIATEMIRVYRPCEPGEGCINRMIMEVKGTNGEQGRNGEFRTDAGSFKILQWVKFYEVPGQYPAWYKPGYPNVPAPRSSRTSWISDRYKPPGFTSGRGAFGWYTAKIDPIGSSNGQWFHGTMGWGADKRSFVDFKESFFGGIAGFFGAFIRSHGCTSMDNESIALMRELLPVGAAYYKIYAREAVRNPLKYGYSQEPGRFDYILTTNGHQKINGKHELPARDKVIAAGTPREQWLEEGTYMVDQYPNARTGDLYKYRDFQGMYVVDEGTLVDYQHPRAIRVGGYKNADGSSKFPASMISHDIRYYEAK